MAGVITGRNSFGASLYYGASPTLLGKLIKLTPAKETAGTVDASHHGSTFVDKIAEALVDKGQIKFQVQYLSASLTAIRALVGTIANWKIVFPGGDFCTFTGILTEFGVDDLETKGSMMTLSGTVEVASDPAWTMA